MYDRFTEGFAPDMQAASPPCRRSYDMLEFAEATDRMLD
jgi:hypothetical protein